MNFLILGDGPEELAWMTALADRPDHRVVAACPGFKGLPGPPGVADLDEALAVPGVEAAIVGGEFDFRAEALRRAAGAGLPVLVLHPPGPNADPYYQVALSHQETGAVVVPDLPARRHPGLDAVGSALRKQELGPLRDLVYHVPIAPGGPDLLTTALPRVVDAIRWALGEIETVTASGTPPGGPPTESLIVLMRGPRDRLAEVRLLSDPLPGPARLVLAGAEGSLTFEHDPSWLGPSRLVRRTLRDGEIAIDLPPWDPREAILDALTDAVAGRASHPDLLDGTRAMEVAEGAGRSLRRGRSVDLHYEEVSEASNFKSVMTGLGCGLLLGALLLLPIALAGPAMGFRWTVYLTWAIPPLLAGFVLLQLLRFAARPAPPRRTTDEIDEASRTPTPTDG